MAVGLYWPLFWYFPLDCITASAGIDHTVRIWDASDASTKAKVILQGLNGVVRQMLFLPDSLCRWSTRERSLPMFMTLHRAL